MPIQLMLVKQALTTSAYPLGRPLNKADLESFKVVSYFLRFLRCSVNYFSASIIGLTTITCFFDHDHP
jgi:hypothetical protein